MFAFFLNMVFNFGMSTNLSDLDRDRQIIASHGGPAKFARLLGIDDAGATQRVSNWLRRGIPASIKLAHLDLFVEAPLTESKEGA
ncbi:hypothetical protein [Burkholderia glumae]|uniref:hypothetical protein n=1 Tax=Burkholderia glumae TaxID=337 RepID=UPI0020CB7432|nr:hypothetical protein [Burkholderia glumae]MCQ0032551.1 hypothetical protein [Burkholderia glumae]MCQ0035811.1 hypothetical protein [Burkholderia glumae]